MELTLSEKEVEVLRDMLEKDIHELLMEIANSDTRKFRDDLKFKEGLLKGIIEKLPVAKVA